MSFKLDYDAIKIRMGANVWLRSIASEVKNFQKGTQSLYHCRGCVSSILHTSLLIKMCK